MHISTAVETPTLSLHGPTNPKFQGPFGSNHEHILLEEVECKICHLLECNKDHECFKNIKNEYVLEKIENLFKKNGISYIV